MHNFPFIFIGMEEGGFACLEALLNNDIAPCAIFTIDESKKTSIVAYKDFSSLDNGKIPFYYVSSINECRIVTEIKKYKPELIVTAYWSEIIAKEILSIPSEGCVGLHSTLLPKHRGCAPIPWSIIYGIKESGMTLFHLSEEADAGDIVGQREFVIKDDDYAFYVNKKGEEAAKSLLVEYVPKLLTKEAPRIKQDHVQADYWKKRKPEDGIIEWRKSARSLYAWVRALSYPFPGAFTYCKSTKVTILESEIFSCEKRYDPGKIYSNTNDNDIIIGTGEGALRLEYVYVDNNKMAAQEFRKQYNPTFFGDC